MYLIIVIKYSAYKKQKNLIKNRREKKVRNSKINKEKLEKHKKKHIPHTTYHIPQTTYHIPHTTYHIPHTTYHIPHTTNHMPTLRDQTSDRPNLGLFRDLTCTQNCQKDNTSAVWPPLPNKHLQPLKWPSFPRNLNIQNTYHIPHTTYHFKLTTSYLPITTYHCDFKGCDSCL